MKLRGMTFPEAYAALRSARPVISPNNGFVRQLELFARLECDLHGHEQERILWNLEWLAKRDDQGI